MRFTRLFKFAEIRNTTEVIFVRGLLNIQKQNKDPSFLPWKPFCYPFHNKKKLKMNLTYAACPGWLHRMRCGVDLDQKPSLLHKT